MPAMGSISVNDGAATPVAHVFAPVDATGGRAELANRSAASPAGWETLKVDVLKPLGKSGSHQVVLELSLPTTATVDGSETVVRSQKVKAFFYLSQLGTTAERKNARVLLQNALAHASVASVIENIEPIY